MLMSNPWDVEAPGLALSGVALGVGTASVLLWWCVNVKTLLPELPPNTWFAPAVNIVPKHLSRSKLGPPLRSWGMSPSPLFLQSVGLQNPCREHHSQSLSRNYCRVTASKGKEAKGSLHFSLCSHLSPCSSSLWSLQLGQSDSGVCIAVLVTVSRCLCV